MNGGKDGKKMRIKFLTLKHKVHMDTDKAGLAVGKRLVGVLPAQGRMR